MVAKAGGERRDSDVAHRHGGGGDTKTHSHPCDPGGWAEILKWGSHGTCGRYSTHYRGAPTPVCRAGTVRTTQLRWDHEMLGQTQAESPTTSRRFAAGWPRAPCSPVSLLENPHQSFPNFARSSTVSSKYGFTQQPVVDRSKLTFDLPVSKVLPAIHPGSLSLLEASFSPNQPL